VKWFDAWVYTWGCALPALTPGLPCWCKVLLGQLKRATVPYGTYRLIPRYIYSNTHLSFHERVPLNISSEPEYYLNCYDGLLQPFLGEPLPTTEPFQQVNFVKNQYKPFLCSQKLKSAEGWGKGDGTHCF